MSIAHQASDPGIPISNHAIQARYSKCSRASISQVSINCFASCLRAQDVGFDFDLWFMYQYEKTAASITCVHFYFENRLNITLKLENAGGSSILVDMNNYLEDLVMICPHCRQLNPSGAFYCIRCQHRLSNFRKV